MASWAATANKYSSIVSKKRIYCKPTMRRRTIITYEKKKKKNDVIIEFALTTDYRLII